MWSDFGVPVSNLNLQLEGIARLEVIGVVSDGERGLIILWVIKYWRLMGQGDFILERQSFRAQRLSLDGEALWGDDGVEVITDVNGRDGISGKTVSDGAGGVIMVYHKGGIDVRIIGGQRISPEGETLWGDSGVSYELNSYLFIGDAVSDNQGGVIFSGQAAQNERRQVRVFRLDQDGDQLFGECHLVRTLFKLNRPELGERTRLSMSNRAGWQESAVFGKRVREILEAQAEEHSGKDT